MSKRKSIVESFGLISADLDAARTERLSSSGEVDQPARVGAGVIGAAHRAIGDIREERDRLKALLESGTAGAVMLAPEVVDPSPFPDRLADDSNEAYASLLATMRDEGQKVPIQVRPHPQASGRYQVVYGHRRVAAARELGQPVRALVVDMSDRDLVIAQGIENAERQDLSWIERALFAASMDAAGIRPRDIYAALSIDDAELARMRSVCRAVPQDIIRAIGRAPKIGRPRWVAFAKAISDDPAKLEAVSARLSSQDMAGMTSDERFADLARSIGDRNAEAGNSSGSLQAADGSTLASLRMTKNDLRLVPAAGQRGQAFLAFLQSRLPQLAAEFNNLENGVQGVQMPRSRNRSR